MRRLLAVTLLVLGGCATWDTGWVYSPECAPMVWRDYQAEMRAQRAEARAWQELNNQQEMLQLMRGRELRRTFGPYMGW